MNKKYLNLSLIVFSIFLIGFISADSISSSSFNINIYNGTLEIKSSDYTGNNNNFTFDMNGLENGSLSFQNFPYNFLFSNVGKEINISNEFLSNYSSCLDKVTSLTIDRNAMDLGWNDCKRQMESLGNTQSNWTTCVTQLATVTADRDSKQTQINQLNTDKTNTSNSYLFWGIGGIILGIVATLFQLGKLPTNKVKTQKDSFNQFQGR